MIKKILHIADIHYFLNNKLRKSFQHVKNELINLLAKDKDIQLVVIVGDLIDSKNILNPEQIRDTTDFLLSILKLNNIILVPGNHDADLSNLSREDSLTFIVENVNYINSHVNNKKIYYLKDSGIYNLFDINWANYSILDPEMNAEKFLKITENSNQLQIGLFHGALNNCISHSGQILSTHNEIDMFKNCNNVFLGDIHLSQSFRDKEIWYPGSWLTLNFGEAETYFQDKKIKRTEKGGIVWEYNEKNKNYVPNKIKFNNPYAFKTIKIEDLNTFEIPKDFIDDRNNQLRLDYVGEKVDYNKNDFNIIRKTLQKEIDSRIVSKYVPKRKEEVQINQEEIKPDKIFQKYFENKGFNEKDIKIFEDIDKSVNQMINSEISIISNNYSIEEITIHNFLSYGPNTKISFKDKKGLFGIKGLNGSGKSNIYNAIYFLLSNEIMGNGVNNQKLINDQINEKAFVQIIGYSGGVKYRVKRSIENSVKLEIYEIQKDGVEIPKHALQRQPSEKILKSIFGDPEIFVLTSLSSQKYSFDFSDKKNKERLDNFLKILGIFIYDEKYKIANKEREELNKTRKDLDGEIKYSFSDIDTVSEKIVKKLEENYQLIFSIEKIDEEINLLKTELLILKKKYDEIELFGSNKTIENIKNDIQKFNELLENNIDSKNKLVNKILLWKNNLLIAIKQENITNDEIENYEIIENYEKRYSDISKLEIQKTQLTNKINNDFICEHCNLQISEVLGNKLDKNKIQKEIDNLLLEINSLKKTVKDEKDNNENIKRLQKTIIYDINELKKFDSQTENLIEKIKNSELEQEIYYNNLEKIKNKEEIKKQIFVAENKISSLNKEDRLYSENFINNNSTIDKLNEKIKKYEQLNIKLSIVDFELNILKFYLESMHRTGIPSLILSTYVPIINYTINQYLETFDFKVEFSIEEEELDISFIHENASTPTKRDVALASGAQDFIIKLAIKASLNKINYLSKANFQMIDEGFGTLDVNNMENVKDFLLRMEDEFENIFVISHLKEIQDLMSNSIEIENIDGISKVNDI